ncbi:MAG: class I SAM-dependent methyltransferase [Deinococcota bacterium]
MTFWNQRYSTEGYAFGTQPNDFLAASLAHIPMGNVLCVADGEGRNGVYLAEQGYQVTSVDLSEVGLAKAQELAESRGVGINTVTADLADYDLGDAQWDGIVSIFCHLPPDIRKIHHQRIVRGLKPSGALLLEAYTPAQLGRGTGGPPNPDLLISLNMLEDELAGLEFVHALETERDIHEGRYHNGNSAVVQLIAVKSKA